MFFLFCFFNRLFTMKPSTRIPYMSLRAMNGVKHAMTMVNEIIDFP